MFLSNLKKLSVVLSIFLVTSCAPTEAPFKGQKIGKPYVLNGKLYRPEPDSTYDKVGDASWYGPGFDGKRTASGEIFDEDDVTAAHPTLPMPSLVKVTNLKNNKSVVVRVNDRGPFHSNRIIDLSKKSAQMIDMKSTQAVRVQFLDRETEDYINSIQGISPKIDMFAYNENYNNSSTQRATELNKQLAIASAQPEQINNEIGTSNRASNANFYTKDVEDFAPIQSVAAQDLSQPPEIKTAKSPFKPSRFVISDAAAEENQSSEKNVYPLEPDDKHKQELVPRKNLVVPMKTVPIKTAEEPKEAIVKPAIAKTPKVSGDDKFMIMAGYFAEKENAQKLFSSVNKAAEQKDIVSVEKITVKGLEWWRVQVGPFDDKEKATQILKVVQNSGAPDAIISKSK